MCETEEGQAARALLDWYDTHARELPWRTGPREVRAGHQPDPYHVWLSEIMLQQTTVATVASYYARFLTLWPTVGDLARAEDARVMAEWAGLGYYARARNLLKCARAVLAEHGGIFPSDRAALLGLPGIGPYTAAAVAAIAFDRPETVMDGNVERVMARQHRVETPLPAAKPELFGLAEARTPALRPGDYAQAVMDLGATICRPRNPVCERCPWQARCRAYQAGDVTAYPVRLPKQAKPRRFGHACVGRTGSGAWILERRPARGLLGGMLGWPGSAWGEPSEFVPPFAANWRRLPATVRHIFTHFDLELVVWIARDADAPNLEAAEILGASAFRPGDLPTVMRKVFDMAEPALADISFS